MVAEGGDAGVGADFVSTGVASSGRYAAGSTNSISTDNLSAGCAVSDGYSSTGALELGAVPTGFSGACSCANVAFYGSIAHS